MATSLYERNRRQKRVTGIALLIVLLLHVAGYWYLLKTGKIKAITNAITTIYKEFKQPPPPAPPPPPPPKFQVAAPPRMDVKFTVNQLQTRPTADPTFNSNLLSNVQTSDLGPSIYISPMGTMGHDEAANVVTQTLVSSVGITANLPGFQLGDLTGADSRGATVGTGRRTTGTTVITFLDIPGSTGGTTDTLWTNGELENIADFISRNTKVKVGLGARAISFTGVYRSFDAWTKKSMEGSFSAARDMSQLEPEIDGLKLLADAMPYLADRQYETFKTRVKKVMADYLRIRFDVKFAVEAGDWAGKIEKTKTLLDWQKEYMTEGENSFRELYRKPAPTAADVKGVYSFLRASEIMLMKVLFCQPRGVPETVSPENLRFLRTYINNGRFIYFINSCGLQTCNGVRGLIRTIIQEGVSDPIGDKTLADLSKGDRAVTGYEFRQPDPLIFHPWTFFPMVIPKYTNVNITIFNKVGTVVFADTLKHLAPRPYLQKNKDYRWHAVDNLDNEVESGYYIYQLQADLCQKTGAMVVSKLRRLPNKKHPIFSSFFPVDDVPTTQPLNPPDLPYGDMGVYGYSIKSRLVICYTEGYGELGLLRNTGTKDSQQQSCLRWVTNVLILAVNP